MIHLVLCVLVAAQDGAAPPAPPPATAEPPAATQPAAQPAPADAPAAPAAAAPAPVTTAPWAVMPIQSPDGAASPDALDLLAAVLSAQLAESGGVKVLSPEELRTLLTTEQTRQGLGATDDGALEEIAAASGAELVVGGKVVRGPDGLTWEAALHNNRTGDVVHQGKLAGRNVQALAARADEMALLLLGKKREVGLKTSAAKRLGFESKTELREFADYREQHPEWGTTEALTQYIIAHNVEENRLALIELGIFALGTFLSFHAVVFGMAALVFYSATPLAILTIPLCFGAGGCCVAGAATMGGAVAVSIWDGLDRSFRKVKKKGCCRDDAIIHDAASSSALRRTAALAILLGGPASLLMSFMALSVTSLITVGSAAGAVMAGRTPYLPDSTRPDVAAGGMFFTPAFACGVCSCVVPCAVGIPLGTLLLLWPDRAPVQEVDE